MKLGNSYLLKHLAVLVLLVVLSLATGSKADPYVLGELVLKMQPGHTLDEINLIFGTIEAQHLVQTDVYLVNTATSTNLDSLASLIESTNAVAFCHPNYTIDPLQPVQSSLPVSDELGSGSFAEQAAATRLSLAATHEFSTGANIRVAVLDGGIDYTHPALQNYAVSGYDYVDDDVDAMDVPGGPNGGHGTFVSGVVHLVAPNAEIRAYRVTDINGESDGYLVAEAILQAVDDQCQVINLSMVTNGVHEAIAEAIAYAAEHEVLVVVAAGNGHDGGAAYPASDSNAFCVAALDTADQLADFSNYGDYIDICAPGVEIYSAYLDHGYAWWGGTSFAAPFVAAQAALLLEYDSTATRQSIIDAISATADDIYDANGEYVGQLGAGLIDPLASLIALRGGASALPVPALYATIQAAIDAAQIGDTILVGPGVYQESIDFDGKVLYLVSSAGPEETILMPAGPGQPVLTMEWVQFGYPGVRGFTFTGVTGANVIDLFYASPRIQDCIFRDNNVTGTGWCVWAETASTTINRCVFFNNGGDGCIRAQLQDVWPIVYITNNTFHRNVAPIVASGNAWGDGLLRVTVVGNIFSANLGTGISSSLPLYRVRYNLFWQNHEDVSSAVGTIMPDTLIGDPQFMSPFGAELYLQPTSPAVDAGDPDPMLNDPDGTRNDIGALPLVPTRPVVIGLTVDGNTDYAPIFTTTPTFSWLFHDSGTASQQVFELEVGTDDDWSVVELWMPGQQVSSSQSIGYAGAALADLSDYFVRVRVFDGVDWSAWSSLRFQLSVTTVIRVPADFSTIQSSMEFASSGDTVLVAPGTYAENIVVPGRNIVLLSESGRDVTIVQPAATNVSLLTFEADMAGGTSTVAGFTFQIGGIKVGPGASFVIRDNRFQNVNTYSILADGFGEGEIVGNEVLSSKQAIDLEAGTCRIDSNTIMGCDTQVGVQISDSRAILRYNTIVASGSLFAVWTLANHQLIVENNTVAYNTGTGLRIDQYFSSADTTVIFNNLVAFNGGQGIRLYNNTHPDEIWLCDYNNAYGNIESDRSGLPGSPDDTLSADPLFIDPADGDFSLPLGSPCIDAGNPDPAYNDPDGTRNDIGSVWSPQTVEYPLAAGHEYQPVNADGYVTDLVPTIGWTYTDESPSTQTMYEIEVGFDQDWSVAEYWATGPVASSATSVPYTGAPLADFHTCFARIRLNNGTGWGSWFTGNFRLHTTGTIRVPEHFASIQDAIDAALDYDTVLVAPGTYEEALTISRKAIMLVSEDGAAVTTLQPPAGQAVDVVTFENGGSAPAVLDGFTVKGGRHDILIEDSAPEILNNVIVDATANGIYLDDAPADVVIRGNVIAGNFRGIDAYISYHTVYVEDNIIRDNVGRGGAWLRSSNNETVTRRNLFLRNMTLDYLPGAAGLNLLNGTHTVHNNTFYQNGDPGTEYSGGVRIVSLAAATDFRNNIVALSQGTGMRFDDSTEVTLAYNDVFGSTHADYIGGSGGEGAISADPMFSEPMTDDFSLQPGSPCIDAGDTALAFVEVDWTRNDIGAISTAVGGGMPFVTHVGVLNGDPTHLIDSLPIISWSYADTLGTQSAFELQVGTDFVWSDAEDWFTGVVPATDTSYQYAGVPLERGEDYFARVRIYNGVRWGGWSGGTLHRNSAVAVPTPASPIFGEAPLLMSLRVTSPIDPEGDPLYFDYELYADSLRDSLLASASLHPAENSPPFGPLMPETRYYWRARANDGLEYSAWSPLTSFQTMTETGQVRLDQPLPASIPCGQSLSFVLSVINDQPDTVKAMFNGFRLYSPDGAQFDSVVGTWENGVIDWTQVFDLMRTVVYEPSDSGDLVGFGGLPLWKPGLPGNSSGEAFRLTTEVTCSEIGRTLCLDRAWLTSTYNWFWDAPIQGNPRPFSPGWDGPHCFTIEQCCVGERGNVNGDSQNANLSDLTYLVNYLFLQGPPPPCLAEANINGDPAGMINLTDLTLLVNHAFVTFVRLPSCGEFLAAPMQRPTKAEAVGLTSSIERDTTILRITSSIDLLGVQLSLIGSGSGEPLLSLDKPFDLYQSVADGLMTAGVFDGSTGAAIPAGGHELVRIPGRWEIRDALAVDRSFSEHSPLIGSSNSLIPSDFELSQNYPNPFNPSTIIRFGLPVTAAVELEVLNILGQRVVVLADRQFEAGYHEILWDGTAADNRLVASGVYFYRLRTESFTESKKMMLLK